MIRAVLRASYQAPLAFYISIQLHGVFIPGKRPETTRLSKICFSLSGRSIAFLYPGLRRRNEMPSVTPTNHLPFRAWLGNFLPEWRSGQKCFQDGKRACKPAWLIIFCLKAINICFLDKVTRFIFEENKVIAGLQLLILLENIAPVLFAVKYWILPPSPPDPFTQSVSSPNSVPWDFCVCVCVL